MEFTVNQIALLAGATVEGDGEAKIASFAKIEEAKNGDITFLANPKYEHHIYTTGATAVIVSRDFNPRQTVSATLIRVENPYATIAHLLAEVEKLTTHRKTGIEQPCFIHPEASVAEDAYVGAFAYIGKGATIGRGAQIYPQTYVGDGASVGEETTLYAGVKVYHGCKIGRRCIIHSGAVVGSDGFGFAPTEHGYDKIPQTGNVVIADDVEIGANTTIDRAMMGSTIISQGVKLDNLIQIAHNCTVGESTVMASQVGIAGSAKIGKNCMFGGQVGIAGHIEIGDGVQIAAQSGIKDSVPSGARLFGTPAMDLREYGRQAINIRRLPDLYKRVDRLEKAMNTTEKEK